MELSAGDFTYISLFFISVILSLAFWLAYKTIEPNKHTLIWSIVFLITALQGLVNAFSHYFPNKELSWILVNASSLFIQWLTWAGFRIRANKTPYHYPTILGLVFIQTLLTYFTIVSPHLGLRIFIPSFGGIMMFLCAWEIYKTTSLIRPSSIAAIIIFIIYGLNQLITGFIALQQGPTPDPNYQNLYLTINLLVMPAAFTGLGIFTLLILSDDVGQKLKKIAITDQLTGALNRRGFYKLAKASEKKAKDNNLAIIVILADIDDFKKINDKYGHQIGDLALREFIKKISGAFDKNSIIGRVGGEEFALLTVTDKTDNLLVDYYEKVETFRKQLEIMPIMFGDSHFHITASFGIYVLDDPKTTIETSLQRADQALYEAKNNGRNACKIFKASQQG